MADVSELPPCRECGAKCQVEVFEGAHIQGRATIWRCSAHQLFGGKCPSDMAYLTQDAWLIAMNSAREVDEGVVDRMAEAIYAATFPERADVEPWIGQHWRTKQHYGNMARAAIAAMGEGDVR